MLLLLYSLSNPLIFLNIFSFSIVFTNKNDPEGRIQILSAIGDAFLNERDPQNYLRLVTALGNLSVDDPDAQEFIAAMDFQIIVSRLEGADQKTLESIKEIASELNIAVK